MEQTTIANTIQISSATKNLMPNIDIGLVHNRAVQMKVRMVKGYAASKLSIATLYH